MQASVGEAAVLNKNQKKPCGMCGNEDCRFMRFEFLREPVAYGRTSQADARLCPSVHVAQAWSKVCDFDYARVI
jgi:hypothetical protein